MIRELEQYREVAPKGTIDFLYRLSDLVQDKRFLHISAVRYGGGMVEILRRIVPIMKAMGIEARWEVIAGTQEFTDVTRRITDGLQGREETITNEMYQTYLDVNARNAKVLNLDADLVFVHDPQPAALVDHRKGGKWVWRCHLDAGLLARVEAVGECLGLQARGQVGKQGLPDRVGLVALEEQPAHEPQQVVAVPEALPQL